MTYPPAPWHMHGQLWLSLFRVREGDHPEREPGVYGAALVSYERPSPLTYSELLVARPVKAAGGRRVNITDIWVDSADSRDGGRDLWAIPKGLCDFERTVDRRPGAAHVVEHHAGRRAGRLRPVHRRLALDAAHAVQGRRPGSSVRPTSPAPTARSWPTLKGSAEGAARAAAPGTSTTQGPLAWLAGKRPLASFRMSDFQMSFG